jgi:hypothetical protein
MDPHIEVAALAHTMVLRALRQFGNDVSPTHSAALRWTLGSIARLAYGIDKGRRAYPLATGLGKTQSIVAFCTALHALRSEKSVAIAASKVEQLCEMQRHLLANGIPEDAIGLVHSYRYDPEKAGLIERFASLPATTGNEERQFLLVTHNKLRGGTPLAQFYGYRGQPRDLLLFDESLIVSDARALAFMELESALGWAAPRMPGDSRSLRFVGHALELLRAELRRQATAGAKPRPVTLPEVSDAELGDLKRELPASPIVDPLRHLIEMSQRPLRALATAQGTGLVTFDIVVPRELESVAIFDASYPIRELERMDPTIELGLHPEFEHIKRYDNVTLHYASAASGRHSMTKDFTGPRLVCSEVVDVVKGLPAEEAVIIFSFKEGTARNQQRVNFVRTIESALRDAGIDTSATVATPQWQDGAAVMVPKPRIVFRTWGQECADSAYAYASNIIFAGIVHRSCVDIASCVVGQRNDLMAPVDNTELRRVMDSEVLHVLYQALSRGSCRLMGAGNQARPMKAWLFHLGRSRLAALNSVMPGVRWAEWQTKYIAAGIRGRTIARIAAFLDELPYECKRVSVKEIKQTLGLTASEATSAFTRALSDYLSECRDWMRAGRSVERRWDFGFD